ncbi:uncharacterized protein BX663DRAFT_503900 [Cokeromyces recurvatus]|uniref:uncharacterized protein n=1 Tax=Cokeromyces recurvatus TaxID=90255 RepID=UPI00221E5291|nr:uncharacterized protein BX663DRAFT_503900 [Cokeromyces recurvatus]KAI7904879.1 hypothetical protein BX663DRAFT_503900 [Cokeromyces recurvatus]
MLDATEVLKLEKSNYGSISNDKKSIFNILLNKFINNRKRKQAKLIENNKRLSLHKYMHRFSSSSRHLYYSKDIIFERNNYNYSQQKEEKLSNEKEHYEQIVNSYFLQAKTPLVKTTQMYHHHSPPLKGILLNTEIKPKVPFIESENGYSSSSLVQNLPSDIFRKSIILATTLATAIATKTKIIPDLSQSYSPMSPMSMSNSTVNFKDFLTKESNTTTKMNKSILENDSNLNHSLMISQLEKVQYSWCNRFDEEINIPSLAATATASRISQCNDMSYSSIYNNNSSMSEFMTIDNDMYYTLDKCHSKYEIWDVDFWKQPAGETPKTIEDFADMTSSSNEEAKSTWVKTVPSKLLSTTSSPMAIVGELPNHTLTTDKLNQEAFPILLELHPFLTFNPNSQRKEAHIKKGRFDIYLQLNE